MPVDTSFYPSPQAPNTVGQLSQDAALINAFNQNRLFQQQFAARQAIGPIYQQSINPQTGELDTNKLLSLAAQDPRVAFMAGDLAQQALARQQAQLGIATGQQALAQKRFGAANQVLGSLLANVDDKGNLQSTPKDAIGAISNLYRTGQLPPDQAMTWINQVEKSASDPAAFREFLTQAQLQSMSPETRGQAVFGTPQTFDTGSQLLPGTISPVSGVHIFGNLSKQLSPEAAAPYQLGATPYQRAGLALQGADVVPIPTQTGTIYATKASLAGMAPGGPMGSAGAPQNPLTGAPAGSQSMTGPTTPKGALSAVPYGAAEAGKEVGQGSGEALNTMTNDVAGAPTRLFQLQQALSALKQTGTGYGTAGRNAVLGFITALPGARDSDVKALQEMKDSNRFYDEANKYLTQYAMNQSSILGQGTDEKLATALSGNASTHINNLAAQDVVKANMGLERYKQAMAAAWNASGQPPQDFNKWRTDFARSVDVRTFVWPLLDARARTEAVKSMTPAEKQTLQSNLTWAQQNGFLQY
jgi:hypothetical protein